MAEPQEHAFHGGADGTSSFLYVHSLNGATAYEAYYGAFWRVPFVGIGSDTYGTPVASTTHNPGQGTWKFDITTHLTENQFKRGFLIVMTTKGSNDTYYDYPVFFTSESGGAGAPKLFVTK